jgi:hypothetical protein
MSDRQNEHHAWYSETGLAQNLPAGRSIMNTIVPGAGAPGTTNVN